MLIKTSKSQLDVFLNAMRTSGDRKRGKRFAWAVICGLCIMFVFLMGAIAHRQGLLHKVRLAFQSGAVTAVGNYVSSFSAQPEQLTIDIKHKHYTKLAH